MQLKSGLTNIAKLFSLWKKFLLQWSVYFWHLLLLCLCSHCRLPDTVKHMDEDLVWPDRKDDDQNTTRQLPYKSSSLCLPPLFVLPFCLMSTQYTAPCNFPVWNLEHMRVISIIVVRIRCGWWGRRWTWGPCLEGERWYSIYTPSMQYSIICTCTDSNILNQPEEKKN